MSKNTKIIAIVGGVLIVLGLAYMMFSGGSTLDAIGCGGKKGKKARKVLTKTDMEWIGCKKYGYIPKLEEKTVDKGKNKGQKYWALVGGKRVEPVGGDRDKATCACLELWKKKCEDPEFRKHSQSKTFKKSGKKKETLQQDVCTDMINRLEGKDKKFKIKCESSEDTDDDDDKQEKKPKGKDTKDKDDGDDDDSDD